MVKIKTEKAKGDRPPNWSKAWMVGSGIVILLAGIGFRYLIKEMGRSPNSGNSGDLVMVIAIVAAGLLFIGAMTKR